MALEKFQYIVLRGYAMNVGTFFKNKTLRWWSNKTSALLKFLKFSFFGGIYIIIRIYFVDFYIKNLSTNFYFPEVF